MHSGATTGEKYGYQHSDDARQKADSLTSGVNNNLSQFDGPADQSPFYKSLLQQGTSSTNQAYDNASRNMKMSMEGAGVGGASGAVAGNNAAIGAQRASALGRVGTDATQSATQMGLTADQMKLGEAGMYSGAGLGYFGNASQAENERLKNSGQMGQAMMQAAMMAAMAA